jgi:hypothetical protein
MSLRVAAPLWLRSCLLAGLVACGDTASPPLTDPPVDDPAAFVVEGTVVFLNLEGGCWGIRVAERTTYEPRGLPSEFRRDGLAVRAAVKTPDRAGSFCMIGPIVDVLWVRRR